MTAGVRLCGFFLLGVIAASSEYIGGQVRTTLVTTGFSVLDLDAGTTARIVLSAAAYLTLMTVLSSALGLLIRRAIPAAAVLLLYLLVVSPLLQSQSWYFPARHRLVHAVVRERPQHWAAGDRLVACGHCPDAGPPGAVDCRSQAA